MKVLFVPSTNPSTKLMSALAAWLSSRGHESALVANPAQQSYLRSLGALGHQVLDFKTMQTVDLGTSQVCSAVESAQRSLAAPADQRGPSMMVRLNQSTHSFSIAILVLYWMLQILRFRWLWRHCVAGLGCQVAFVWGDNAGTTNGELLNYLKAGGARLVHLPVALSDQKIIARLRVGVDVLRLRPGSAWLSRMLARFFPDQLFDFEGHNIFYFHPAEALAMALLGVLPARPWVLGGSRADYVCLPDSAQRDYWLRRGLEDSKVRLVGNLDLQNVTQDMVRLSCSYPDLFEQQLPLVLINMPNLVEHNVIQDWKLFWDEVRKIFAPFANNQVTMVTNLHPKSRLADYESLTQTYGCLLTQGDIGAWIGLADLYVSVCSTTEIIANDMGVPVLDLGPIYGFDSEVLNALPNVAFFSFYEDYERDAKALLQKMCKPPRRLGQVSESSFDSQIKPYEKLKHLIETEILLKCTNN